MSPFCYGTRRILVALLLLSSFGASRAQVPERVRPFAPPSATNNELFLRFFTEFRGKTYFVVNRANTDELWVTDGTADGTDLVETFGSVQIMTASEDYLFFNASGSGGDSGLYSTDGTPGAATFLSPTTMLASEIDQVEGRVFYIGREAISVDGFRDEELWVTDGMVTGTYRVADIVPGPRKSEIKDFVRFGDRLFFTAIRRNENGSDTRHLWITDGTSALLLTPDPHSYGTIFLDYSQVVFQDRLFFTYNDNQNGRELWVSDGTLEGTHLVKDLNPGSSDGWPKQLTILGDALVFFANTPNNPPNRTQLWRSDGTAGGTTPIRPMEPSTLNGARLTPLGNGSLAFGGRDGGSSNPFRLWVTDGTAGGTVLLSEEGTNPDLLTVSGPRLFYYARTDAAGYELWVTAGIPEGTHLVGDINPGTDNADIRAFFRIEGDRVAFVAAIGSGDYHLFASDGTSNGTGPLAPPGATNDVGPLSVDGFASVSPIPLGESHEALFFQARYVSDDPGLYRLGEPRPTSVAGDHAPRPLTSLGENFPNPFRRSTRIGYTLSTPDHIRLTIYDVLGREVVRLVEGQRQPGEHEAVLDASRLAPGLYLVLLEASGQALTRRITVVR